MLGAIVARAEMGIARASARVRLRATLTTTLSRRPPARVSTTSLRRHAWQRWSPRMTPAPVLRSTRRPLRRTGS
eukprot:8308903-Alexandrium_andersonii.AAC.1